MQYNEESLMQSKSSLWKRRCGRNHGFEMFHGSWASRWLHDDSLHTETKMRHKRSKRICKNWVIVYPLSRVADIVKCWLTRWALMSHFHWFPPGAAAGLSWFLKNLVICSTLFALFVLFTVPSLRVFFIHFLWGKQYN